MDLFDAGVPEVLALTIKTEIDNNSMEDNPPRPSWRVKPGSLGKECIAQQWYNFRWVRFVQKPGQIIRLFQRGNKEERTFVDLLRRAGWEVRDFAKRLCYHAGSDSYIALDWDTTDLNDGLGELIDVSDQHHHIAIALKRDKWCLKQWRVKALGGHYSGYLDAKVRHPRHTNNEWVVLECKTYKSRLFSTLVSKKSVLVSNYDYYCQMVQYMDQHKLGWCLFMAINKDDDDLYFEFVQANPELAITLMGTAHTIATSIARPARIAQSPAFHKCKVCDFTDICHGGAPVLINCRSCANCHADIDTGEFKCIKWGADIPDEKAIMAACPHHLPVR